MNRFVVMVDAGYLLRQAIEIASNRQSKRRAELEISSPSGLIAILIAAAKALLDLKDKELLRVYWYDGVMANGLTPQQRALVEVDDVQFRAGTINGAGQQKGVDSLIVTDLIELTSHHAICDAILVTGDSDLAVGIELAQKRGVRIAVLGVEDLTAGVAHHQSFEITSRADRVGRLGGADLSAAVRYLPPAAVPAASVGPQQGPPRTPQVPTPVSRAAQAPLASLDTAIQTAITAAVTTFFAQQASPGNMIDPATKRIDGSVDRQLIHHVFVEMAKGQLTNAEKVFARSVFRGLIPRPAAQSSGPP